MGCNFTLRGSDWGAVWVGYMDRAVKDKAVSGKAASLAEVKARSENAETPAGDLAAKKPRRG